MGPVLDLLGVGSLVDDWVFVGVGVLDRLRDGSFVADGVMVCVRCVCDGLSDRSCVDE